MPKLRPPGPQRPGPGSGAEGCGAGPGPGGAGAAQRGGADVRQGRPGAAVAAAAGGEAAGAAPGGCWGCVWGGSRSPRRLGALLPRGERAEAGGAEG